MTISRSLALALLPFSLAFASCAEAEDVNALRAELAAIEDQKLREFVLVDMIRTAPGEGLRQSEIKYLSHDFGKKSYNAVSGMWRYKNAANWLVLKDGWAYKNPDISPSEFNAELSRALEAERWVKADTLSLESDFKAARKGTRFALLVERPNVTGNGFMSAVSRKGLALSEDGRFETSLSVLAGSTDAAATVTGETVMIADRRDGSGRSRVLSASTGETITRGSGEDRSGAKSNRGTYMVDGWDILLRYDNGVEVRLPFAMKRKEVDGNVRTSVILGDTYYFD